MGPNTLKEMIWGFHRAIIAMFAIIDIGPCGGREAQQKWSIDMSERRQQMNLAMEHFAIMIASLQWYQGDRNTVEGVVAVFQLYAGWMPQSVVATCAKWLGAGEDTESRTQAVEELIRMLNHRSSGWRAVEVRGYVFPAIDSGVIKLHTEMKQIEQLPYYHPHDEW
jgi:hypothetical protein